MSAGVVSEFAERVYGHARLDSEPDEAEALVRLAIEVGCGVGEPYASHLAHNARAAWESEVHVK